MKLPSSAELLRRGSCMPDTPWAPNVGSRAAQLGLEALKQGLRRGFQGLRPGPSLLPQAAVRDYVEKRGETWLLRAPWYVKEALAEKELIHNKQDILGLWRKYR